MTAETTPTPPPAEPTPPAESGNATSPSLSPARIVAGLGAIVTVVSIFLNWADVSGGAPAKGTDVPFDFLWDKHTTSSDPSLLVPLLIAAVLIGLGVLLPTARLAGIIGGVLAIAVVAVYCVQVQGVIDDRGLGISLTDFISTGVYVAFVGGVLGLVGAAIPSRT